MIVSYLSVKLAIMCSTLLCASKSVSTLFVYRLSGTVFSYIFIYKRTTNNIYELNDSQDPSVFVCAFYFLSLVHHFQYTRGTTIALQSDLWVMMNYFESVLEQRSAKSIFSKLYVSYKYNVYKHTPFHRPSSILHNFSGKCATVNSTAQGNNVRLHQFYHIFNK